MFGTVLEGEHVPVDTRFYIMLLLYISFKYDELPIRNLIYAYYLSYGSLVAFPQQKNSTDA